MAIGIVALIIGLWQVFYVRRGWKEGEVAFGERYQKMRFHRDQSPILFFIGIFVHSIIAALLLVLAVMTFLGYGPN